ncbi:MAG TPA: DUF5723 family protein, partial [Balneolaceae bacterium]|nr:DUF5723 family protein [Balneolaceae bacterium]
MAFGKRFLLLAVLSGWGIQAGAQSTHLTAKSMALGGGGAAYVSGYHANFINPANLMLESDQPRITLGLIGGISSTAGGPLANIHVYNTYFTKGLTVTGSIAEEALTKWFGSDPAAMKQFQMRTEFVPVGLSFRAGNWAVGLALRSRVLMNTAINKGFAQLGILGFDTEVFGEGQPVNFTAEMLAFYEASLGLSVKLLEIENAGFAKNVKLYAGAAPKLLLGASTFRFDFNSVLTLQGADQNAIDEIRHDFNYRLETTGEITEQLTEYYRARESQSEAPDFNDYLDPAAKNFYGIKTSGLGLDLGATMEMDLHMPIIGAFSKGAEHLQVGVSLTDLGSLSFTEKAGVFAADDELVWRGF